MAAPLLIPQGPRGAVAPLQVVERVVEAGGRPPCVHMATCGVWLLEHVGRGQVSRVEVEVSRPLAARAFRARWPCSSRPLGRGLLAGGWL